MLALCLSLLLMINPPVADNETEVPAFQLVTLPYAPDALEPFISKATIELHHGKHLQAYIDNLNRLVRGTRFAGLPLETIVAESDGALFNNAGQALNHNLYFMQFSPQGGGEPMGELAEAINRTWGSFDNFRLAFVKAGSELFGSGWVWLAKDANGALYILQEPNGSNPITKGLTPLLGFDVWEHAYYLDYQNRRADHLDALWNIIDWNAVGQRYSGNNL